MINEIDKNNDGEIDFGEFVAVMSRKVQATYTAEEVKNAFKVSRLCRHLISARCSDGCRVAVPCEEDARWTRVLTQCKREPRSHRAAKSPHRRDDALTWRLVWSRCADLILPPPGVRGHSSSGHDSRRGSGARAHGLRR